jgi:hypothetical protein
MDDPSTNRSETIMGVGEVVSVLVASVIRVRRVVAWLCMFDL